jgi:hypothetical protein
MLSKLRDIVENHPKHFAQMISRSPELLAEINSISGDSIAEKVYKLLNPQTVVVCEYGASKKFHSMAIGYRYCGKTGSCQCAKSAVSEKVSLHKASLSEDEKEKSHQKRVETNIKKYGVTNTGQTEKAKQRHKEVYKDRNKVSEINDKVAQTKIRKHGSSTYNNAEKISETWQSKTSSYWSERYPEKEIETLHDNDAMIELYNTKSIDEICQELNVSETTVYRHLTQHGIRKPYVSAGEQQIDYFLREDLRITNIQRNNRKILRGRELDFYLPDYNIAIEYNGLYWHHEDVPQIHPLYHQQKFKECESLGIQLITLFSNHWTHQKQLVKNMLTHKLGISDEKIYARQCKIVELSAQTAKSFCLENHIQGHAPCSIKYGLMHNGDLVAFMGLSKMRPALGHKQQEGSFELVRYTTSKQVVGGASKLLSHFKKNQNWTSITSYSNNEWSHGGMYAKLGFDFVRETKPGYWYVHPREEKMLHRYAFAKHKLVEKGFDANLTETEIVKEHLNLLKVWDCGQKVWTLTNTDKILLKE